MPPAGGTQVAFQIQQAMHAGLSRAPPGEAQMQGTATNRFDRRLTLTKPPIGKGRSMFLPGQKRSSTDDRFAALDSRLQRTSWMSGQAVVSC